MQALDESVSEKVEGKRAQRAAGAGLTSSKKEFEKTRKKLKKVLDKSEAMWYNHWALLRERKADLEN